MENVSTFDVRHSYITSISRDMRRLVPNQQARRSRTQARKFELQNCSRPGRTGTSYFSTLPPHLGQDLDSSRRTLRRSDRCRGRIPTLVVKHAFNDRELDAHLWESLRSAATRRQCVASYSIQQLKKIASKSSSMLKSSTTQARPPCPELFQPCLA